MSAPTTSTPEVVQTVDLVEWKSRQGWLALTATIMASGLAFLDSSVVGVALPHIESDLGGGFATLQWVMNGYLLTLGALVLVGGALGDLIGKRRMFLAGVVGFGITSILCGLAPTSGALVGARMLQGAAAALMIPTSLAILNTIFRGPNRSRAIGAWSGLSGLFTAIGPFIGGIAVQTGSSGWRWIFLINIPLVIGAVFFARAAIPPLVGSRTAASLRSQVDFAGGVLAVVGLLLVVGPLIEVHRLGGALTAGLVGLGLVVLVAFGLVENRRAKTLSPPPLIRLSLFRIRTFRIANLLTFVVYGSLGAAFFLVTVSLQVGMGYSAIAAGAAGIPVTIMMAGLSAKMGGVLQKVGARPLLTIGPALMAVGMTLLAIMRPGESYWVGVFPGYTIFGLGLACVVAPVTATALTDVSSDQSGAAAGVNNALARIASLAMITVLPVIAGMATSQADTLVSGVAFLDQFRVAMLIAAGTCLAGAVVAAVGFRSGDGRTLLMPDSIDLTADA
ncbi:MAG: MFS transporter [Actinomycetes bacterium]